MRKALIFSLLLLSTGQVPAQQRQALSAQEIHDKMVSVYASCSSYEDKGVEKEAPKRGVETLRLFSTAFVRPSQFRFEFVEVTDNRPNYVIWQNGPSIRSWWSMTRQLRSFEALDRAMYGAIGVSRGAAIQVPTSCLLICA